MSFEGRQDAYDNFQGTNAQGQQVNNATLYEKQ
jgi:hypothetical protein